MKFKKDGKVFEEIVKAVDAYCVMVDDCQSCVLDCENYCVNHPAEAARLMGYEVVEEERHCGQCKFIDTDKCSSCGLYENFEPKEANMEKVNDAAGGREAGLGHKQKPLKDWTLGEVKEYCKKMHGDVCYDDTEPNDCLLKKCNLCCNEPQEMDLTETPRFTEEEVEDARAIVRLFGTAYQYVCAIKEDGETEYVLKTSIGDVDGHYMCIEFPSILPGQSVKISDIVGGEA